MKKIVLHSIIAIGILSMQSCGGSSAPLDQAAIDAKVNAAADAKIKELEATTISECETRRATEVKQMADSIVHTSQMQNAKK